VIGKAINGDDITQTFNTDNSTNVGVLVGMGIHTSEKLQSTVEALFVDDQQQLSVGMAYRF